LVDALRVEINPRLVLVGAGGKTTTLFRLARELQPPVIVTATTHLATDQLSLADHLILVERPKDLATLAGHQIQDVTLITGPETEDDRMQGVEAEILESILNLANSQEYPLLIEADGSRKLPLKAPADHEPAIPVLGSLGTARSWLDAVIVVAGLSGLGKPLTSDWVHRPERFAELSGLDIGAKITPDALGRVLTHPSGGLKNIPANARRVLLLNQADTLDLQAQAQRVILGGSSVASLLSSYNAVIIASIKSDHIYAVHESVAGIVLAAGESSRFGEPKQLLSWHGEPFIRHVARKALTAGLSPVIVVTGAHSSQVKRAVEDLEVVVVQNHSWKEGQSTSIKTGLEALPQEVGAAIFL
ncbi:MAG: putative selenium-dependent hydroxylase accessory protein YqeC, partial [Anaerolineales bacterium]|nr:putative selenium-dependent hydroxylase accessory protein YqeC [Anaerolineales bacterium]